MDFQNKSIETATSEIEHKYLTFALDEETYGVPVKHVVGIVEATDLIPVPHSAAYFLGLMDVRGRVLPVIDLKIKLSLQLEEEHQGERAIIIDMKGNRVALLVDTVFHVERFLPENIDSAPPSIQDGSTQYVRGIGKSKDQFVVLLELEGLFADEELKGLSQTAPE